MKIVYMEELKMEIKKARITLENTIKTLRGFERKYKMSSLDFYVRYEQGDIEEKEIEDFDVIEWASAYETFIRLMNKRIAAEVA